MKVRLTDKRGSLANAVGGGRRRRRWNWAHFAYGFLPVAFIAFFSTRMPYFARFWPHVVETLVVAAVAGSFTALSGERGFEGVLRMLGRS
jgi:hypothetical protein